MDHREAPPSNNKALPHTQAEPSGATSGGATAPVPQPAVASRRLRGHRRGSRSANAEAARQQKHAGSACPQWRPPSASPAAHAAVTAAASSVKGSPVAAAAVASNGPQSTPPAVLSAGKVFSKQTTSSDSERAKLRGMPETKAASAAAPGAAEVKRSLAAPVAAAAADAPQRKPEQQSKQQPPSAATAVAVAANNLRWAEDCFRQVFGEAVGEAADAAHALKKLCGLTQEACKAAACGTARPPAGFASWEAACAAQRQWRVRLAADLWKFIEAMDAVHDAAEQAIRAAAVADAELSRAAGVRLPAGAADGWLGCNGADDRSDADDAVWSSGDDGDLYGRSEEDGDSHASWE